MVLWIPNLQGYKNCMISSKVTTLPTFFSSCWLDPQSQDVPAERVSRGRYLAVAVVVNERWQVEQRYLYPPAFRSDW